MKFCGRFTIFPGMPEELTIENNTVDQGENDYLQMIFQGNNVILPAGNNFFVGLMGATWDETTTLATISGEPTGAGGYARQPIARSAVGFPTIGDVNGVKRIQSLTINFTASGADFSAAFSRMFLCNVVSGTAGRLFAVSGAFPSPILVTNGLTLPARYEAYLR